MTIDFYTLQRILSIKEKAESLGFILTQSHGRIALRVNNDSFPIYSRDTILFTGEDIFDLDKFLHGYEFALQYLKQIKAVSDKKIEDTEQKILNRQLMEKLNSE